MRSPSWELEGSSSGFSNGTGDMMSCPKVQEKIDEVERRHGEGLCWCPCVDDDLPKAKELASEKKCGAANSVIKAALARCFRTRQEAEAENYEVKTELKVKPIKNLEIKPLEW